MFGSKSCECVVQFGELSKQRMIEAVQGKSFPTSLSNTFPGTGDNGGKPEPECCATKVYSAPRNINTKGYGSAKSIRNLPCRAEPIEL